MAIVVGSNSWVTIVEADEYLTDRQGAAGWFSFPDSGNPGEDSKTVFLVTAYRTLINYPGVSIPESSTDDLVKEAQSELALWISKFGDDAERRQALYDMGVRTFSASRDWKETLEQYGLPASVTGLLDKSGYYTSGSATVVMVGE